MKTTISITLDGEVTQYLRSTGENISGLINNLLGDYIKTGKSEKKTAEDLTKELTKLTLKEIELKTEKNKLLKEQELINIEREGQNRINEIKKEKEETEKQTQERIEYSQKITNFFSNLTDEERTEYLEGIKTGKWKSTTEYYKIKNEM